ncbi:MAG: DUF1292 domain-containing protein [Bacillota bacterium]
MSKENKECNCGDDCNCTPESNCGCGGHEHHHEHHHHGGCGCGCGDDDGTFDMQTMFLTLEDDEEVECAVLGIFDVDGVEGEFIALLPLHEDEEDDDGTVLLYKYNELEDEVELSNIDSDEVFEKVSTTFYDLFEEE